MQTNSEILRAIRAATLRIRLATLEARANFNPGQPRVPAGNADGGRWTDSGGSWRLLRRERIAGGEKTTHAGPGGVRIASERLTGSASGRIASRHFVQAPGGVSLVVENDRDGTQRIIDGEGNLISASRWGRNGPEPLAIAEPAYFDDRPKTPKTGPGPRGGLLLLFDLFMNLGREDRIPAIGGKIRDYRRGEGSSSAPLTYVGELEKHEVEAICRRYPEVQAKLTEVAARLRPANDKNPMHFGNLVHWEVANYINDLADRNFRAEVTDVGGRPGQTRYRGSTFLDVYEVVSNELICVYDHKTGNAGLSPARWNRIRETAARMNPDAVRILIIELLPEK